MTKLFKNGYVFTKNGFEKKDFTIVGNTIRVLDTNNDSFDFVIDCISCCFADEIFIRVRNGEAVSRSGRTQRIGGTEVELVFVSSW